ncbi:hypothetical protein EFD32_1101 [Enterococcus faecalis D32]|nr:hypothetical protein EFD32_1101 [Enterococcus faecalis D32]
MEKFIRNVSNTQKLYKCLFLKVAKLGEMNQV